MRISFLKVVYWGGLFLSASVFAGEMKLESATVQPDASLEMNQVFNGFGCTGKNISPELHWTGAPSGTKSFVVTVYDPDAPTGSGWWHWLAFNIPANVTKLEAGAGTPGSKKFPKGAIQSRTDFGKPGYGGPCPPVGDKPHHYVFTVFALKSTLPLKADATAAMVGFYANQNKLDSASFIATYGR